MGFTNAEKIQIAMLRDLAKPIKEREVDFEFIGRCVANDDAWALQWQYPGLQLEGTRPTQVSLVIEIFTMWQHIEEGFDSLDDQEKARVRKEAYEFSEPRFRGFWGHEDAKLLHIARILVEDLDAWPKFADRELDSHMPLDEVYHRMLDVWQPLWDAKVKGGFSRDGGYDLSAEELIAILRESVHPEHRQKQADGTWTYERPKREGR